MSIDGQTDDDHPGDPDGHTANRGCRRLRQGMAALARRIRLPARARLRRDAGQPDAAPANHPRPHGGCHPGRGRDRWRWSISSAPRPMREPRWTRRSGLARAWSGCSWCRRRGGCRAGAGGRDHRGDGPLPGDRSAPAAVSHAADPHSIEAVARSAPHRRARQTHNRRVAPNDQRRTRHHHPVHRAASAARRRQASHRSVAARCRQRRRRPCRRSIPRRIALIAEQFTRYPEARYRLTQLAFVQEHALAEAQNRIQRLEWEQQQAQQALQQASSRPSKHNSRRSRAAVRAAGYSADCSAAAPDRRPRRSRARLAGVESGRGAGLPAAGQYQQAAPPPPQYAPSYQPGMFQRSGSGFLGSALTTAAGVAGGLVAVTR